MKINGLAWLEKLDKHTELEKYRSEVELYNSQALTTTSFVGMLCGIALTILSLPFVGALQLFIPYTLLMLFFGGMFALSKTFVKAHRHFALPMYYCLMAIIMGIGIWMGTAQGLDTNAVTFMLFLLLFPLFIIDRPWRLMLFNVTASIAFYIAAVHIKSPGPILDLDISNTAVVCALSAVFIVVTVQRQLTVFAHKHSESDKMMQKDMLINAIPVGIAIYEVRGTESRQVFTNDHFYKLFEDTREARAARTNGSFINSIYPDDRADLLRAMKSVIDGRDDMVQVCRSIKGNGEYIWVRFAASVARRENDYIEIYCTYSSMEEEIKNKQASEAKTTFLSRMSHDIRTPMNAIIGMTNLAQKESDMERVQEYLGYIDHSSQFLLGLINDVLDLSKIESGEFTLTPEPLLFSDLAKDVSSIIAPLMQRRMIDFVYQMNCTPECIIVDKLRFNQIFFNLLSNASKFTPEGGKVAFLSRDIPPRGGLHGIRFIVRDTGTGMSEEFQKHMFTPFMQDSLHRADQENGTGLGLPIVKSIVDAMSGTISVNSRPGQGTEISVDLYVEVAAGAQTDVQPRQTQGSLAGMKILMAEDNSMNILVARRLLESRGCIITVACNGAECLAAFRDHQPGTFDAILMDVRMPVMDGIEATKRIRALPRPDAKQIAIIAMTADAFSEEKKKTIQAGMNAHLSKPIVPGLLFDTLAQYRPK